MAQGQPAVELPGEDLLAQYLAHVRTDGTQPFADVDMVDTPAHGTAEDAKAGKLTLVVGGPDAAVERCWPIFEALGERILRAGAAGSGQAASALSDFLRGVEILAAT